MGTTAKQRLVAAIRRFTNDGEAPNGEAERQIERLSTMAMPGDVLNGFAKMCEAMADDTGELRRAAQEFFGPDFDAAPSDDGAECPTCGAHIPEERLCEADRGVRRIAEGAGDRGDDK